MQLIPEHTLETAERLLGDESTAQFRLRAALEEFREWQQFALALRAYRRWARVIVRAQPPESAVGTMAELMDAAVAANEALRSVLEPDVANPGARPWLVPPATHAPVDRLTVAAEIASQEDREALRELGTGGGVGAAPVTPERAGEDIVWPLWRSWGGSPQPRISEVRTAVLPILSRMLHAVCHCTASWVVASRSGEWSQAVQWMRRAVGVAEVVVREATGGDGELRGSVHGCFTAAGLRTFLQRLNASSTQLVRLQGTL